MLNISSDGVYSRPGHYESAGDVNTDDPLHPELRAVLNEFQNWNGLLAIIARVGSEMKEYGLDPSSDEGQIKAAEVIRKRITSTRYDWQDGALERHRRRVAIEQSGGTDFVYYLDLYGAAVKIGYSSNVLVRLRALRRSKTHLLAIEPGGRALEALRHAEFDAERIGHVEDFERSRRLLDHIEKVRAEHGEPLDQLADAGRKTA